MPIFPKSSLSDFIEIFNNQFIIGRVVSSLVGDAFKMGANYFRIYVIHESSSLIFYDNGGGLAMQPDDNDNSPYVDYFSFDCRLVHIAVTKGDYRLLSPLEKFYCANFSLITRCLDESKWRVFNIDTPFQRLTTASDITPLTTDTPWNHFSNFIHTESEYIQKTFDKEWFQKEFATGTLIYSKNLYNKMFFRRMAPYDSAGIDETQR